MTQKKVIEIKNLTKKYGDITGVKNLNLAVHKGEIMGFLGPNGSGKTTTLRCCLALISKTGGSIAIFEKDSHRDAVSIRKKTGYLPGDFGLIPGITVKSYLKYLLSLSHSPSMEKMLSLSQRLDLDLNRKTHELSKGTKQKVGIVQALMADQSLIIMDEPSGGLDPLMQQEFYKILREEKRQGKTIFMSSHILSEAETVCDRVAIIKEGELMMVESMEVLREKTGKILEVEFRQKVDINQFKIEGVSEIRQSNGKITLIIHKNLDDIIKTVANYPISNMNLKTYNLEQLFLKYYADKENKKERLDR